MNKHHGILTEDSKGGLYSIEEINDIIDEELEERNSDFPIEVFPKVIQKLIKDADKSVGFNEEFFSAGILSACATAIGNSIKLNNGSYICKPILWVSIIGRSGIGKTHPLDFSKKPLEDRDKKSYDSYKQMLKEYELNDKNGNRPKYSKNILKDFTPEKLAENLQYNSKGTLIFKDELLGWINSFDRYSKSADQQMYLELFNGGTLTVDRKTSEPIRVEETNVNIVGGMQPNLIKRMAGNSRNEDGFLSRFLFVFPKRVKPNLFTGNSISDVNVMNYNRLICNLFELEDRELSVDEPIVSEYIIWQNNKVDKHFSDDLETSIQSKLQTYVWRFALIIEMMHQATASSYNDTLSKQSLIKAIKLAEYFRTNAMRVYNKILIDNPLESLEQNKLELYRELPMEFKRIQVVELFEKYNIRGGSIGRFLAKDIFTQPKYGIYKKKY